jgi:hypothetical protein
MIIFVCLEKNAKNILKKLKKNGIAGLTNGMNIPLIFIKN